MIGTFGLVATGVVWGYEAGGYWRRRWPTITSLVRPHRSNRFVFTVGCAAVHVVALWAIVHLFSEEP